MGWTTPRTFVTGELETAAIFNTHLRDNLNYLYGGGDAGYASGSAALANDTYAALTNWTGVGYGGVTVSTSGLLIGLAGVYQITVTAVYAASATGSRLTLFRKNSTGFLECGHATCTKAGIQAVTTFMDMISLVPGDLIDFQFRQDSGGSLNVSAAATLKRLGA